MKIFKDRIGLPTLIAVIFVLLLSLISLPGYFNYFRKAGTGHSFRVNLQSGMTDTLSRERARQDGIQSGILMVLGQHIPITILILIVIGLISNSTTVPFKKILRMSYIVVFVIGAFFLSLGSSYWGQALSFPSSLGTSLLIYIVLSVVLWSIIGFANLIILKVHRQNIEK